MDMLIVTCWVAANLSSHCVHRPKLTENESNYIGHPKCPISLLSFSVWTNRHNANLNGQQPNMVLAYPYKTRQSEMANTSPATCQCLATFTPLKSKILKKNRDVISLLARVVILLIDTATQEVPMTNI